MFKTQLIAQPSLGTNVETVGLALAGGGITKVAVAGAYVTMGGADVLIRRMEGALGDDWAAVEKRWLVAIDYYRTEPVAARRLAALPNSEVRMHDAKKLLKRACWPKVPFHPKTFILSGQSKDIVYAGSGNLSRSGLTIGHEVGALLQVEKPFKAADQATKAEIAKLQNWFQQMFAAATPFDDVIDDYEAQYEARPNLKNPTPTDDDLDNAGAVGALSPTDLRKLRACRHLWIQTDKVTRNLGPNVPGNQLMMKRMSRVFFGVPASGVGRDTHLAHPTLVLQGQPFQCSLTFSNNGMDKLTLPVPGLVPKYDNEVLLFTRKPDGSFKLAVGAGKDPASWRRKSASIDADFEMKGGRRWGVF